MEKLKIIYLMGAGRSGTTILASLLGANKNITTVGEMHQYLEHIIDAKTCSCGETLDKCEFWGKIHKNYIGKDFSIINSKLEKVESHSRIPISLCKKNKEYIEFQETLFKQIYKEYPSKYYLDSSKFIGKALQLLKSDIFDVKIIYMIRDVRGVINSFSKKVQTHKKPISTIIYYSFINLTAQIVKWIFPKRIIKIKYEDFVSQPEKTIALISSFLNENLDDVIDIVKNEKHIKMPHIIGGNRLKKQTKIKLRKDVSWQKNISRPKQIIYYLLTLPLMLLNKYKI